MRAEFRRQVRRASKEGQLSPVAKGLPTGRSEVSTGSVGRGLWGLDLQLQCIPGTGEVK